ncbi:MAG: folylpolyglutamate synthase/dihydrofolate synthase family protein [Myxococcota bacterium]|nr:folylpolyglutamate synthase/dihydrofolate synthase family protein [Myxococcota bacterium]
MNVFDGPNQVVESNDEAWNTLLEDLFSLARKGMILGLERLTPYLEKLGHPENALNYVHVAGTNGKGSTCAFLASILAHAGYSVTVYSSPHLECLTERVTYFNQGQREHLSRSTWIAVLREIESLSNGFEDLTFFEVITLTALKLMSDLKPDFAIVEAGLGARLDATRVVNASVSVLTDVGLDHCQYLGDTVEEILAEKLAVVRPRCALVSAVGHELVSKACVEAKSPLYRIGTELDVFGMPDETFQFRLPHTELESVKLGLAGEHQSRNALLAVQTAYLLAPNLESRQIIAGLANAKWPGRLEHGRDQQGVEFLLDGAHNPTAAEKLAEYLRVNVGRPVHAVFGVMKDKDIAGIIHPMIEHVTSWTITYGNSPRFSQVDAITDVLRDFRALQVTEESTPIAAYTRASSKCQSDGGLVVVFGSLILIGELRGKLATCS